jgi:hypothetical protein
MAVNNLFNEKVLDKLIKLSKMDGRPGIWWMKGKEP